MLALYLILYVLAAACFLTFAVANDRPTRFKVNLLGLGVFFWSLVPLIQTLQKV